MFVVILLLGAFGLISPNGTANLRLVHGFKDLSRITWLHLRLVGRHSGTVGSLENELG